MPYHTIRDSERLQSLISAMMLIEADAELDVLLRHLVRSACELVGAQYGALGVLDPTTQQIKEFITVGITDEVRQAIGRLPVGHGLLGEVIESGQSLRVDPMPTGGHSEFPANHPPMHNFLGAPVRTGDGTVFGNLYLTNKRSGTFSEEDEGLIETLGRAAGLVIDQARQREQIELLTLTHERARMARDLHDTVIQRLFAVGLSLQSTLTQPLPEGPTALINEALDDLDDTIRTIRTTIFDITQDPRSKRESLRSDILRVIEELPSTSGLHVDVLFDGPLDTLIGPKCRAELLASLRELLSNVVHHAAANRATASVSVRDGVLTLRVSDNGRGFDETAPRGNGINNMTTRAQQLSGTFAVSAQRDGGTVATWRVEGVSQ